MASSKYYKNDIKWSNTASKLCWGPARIMSWTPWIIFIMLLMVITKICYIYNQVLFEYSHSLVGAMTNLDWIWYPLLMGIATTVLSWIVLYLDSNIPGIDPPLPFSPKIIRQRSGHTFHLQYAFTIYFGMVVSAAMVYNQTEPVIA